MDAIGIYLGCIDKEKKERNIADVPVLGDLDYQWNTERTRPTQTIWEVNKPTNTRDRVAKSKKRAIASLSAYCTFSQRPLSTSGRFSEFDLDELLVERNLSYIRTLGHDSIRPIGIAKTIRELEREKNDKQENKAPTQNTTNCLPEPMENRNETQNAATINDLMLDLDQGVHSEQEESYNYDDEFDRVEHDGTIEQRPTGRLVAGTGLYAEDSQILQQFEESIIPNNRVRASRISNLRNTTYSSPNNQFTP
ncbi:HDR184Wp [Eremothecium sinecaudum]|uniref:HDR184Wp n=1 Tax=Eremothecium sinecaudum TaxID=45286 RepID=A0A109UZ94_9SACH|nr:HDR184Wp [Eremothecium sinecaudum]AMD20926.1 HDR184Wp [Eremothecium sinecaudum]